MLCAETIERRRHPTDAVRGTIDARDESEQLLEREPVEQPASEIRYPWLIGRDAREQTRTAFATPK